MSYLIVCSIGPLGMTGDDGMIGNIGSIGPIGSNGSIGSTGQRGLTGVEGSLGHVGSTGNTGDIGLVGPVGIIGYIGHTGPTGSKGIDGHIGPVGLYPLIYLYNTPTTTTSIIGNYHTNVYNSNETFDNVYNPPFMSIFYDSQKTIAYGNYNGLYKIEYSMSGRLEYLCNTIPIEGYYIGVNLELFNYNTMVSNIPSIYYTTSINGTIDITISGAYISHLTPFVGLIPKIIGTSSSNVTPISMTWTSKTSSPNYICLTPLLLD